MLHTAVLTAKQWHGQIIREELQARLRLCERAARCRLAHPQTGQLVLGLQPSQAPPSLENDVTRGVSTTSGLMCPVWKGQLHYVRGRRYAAGVRGRGV